MRLTDGNGTVFRIDPVLGGKNEVAIWTSHPDGEVTEVIFDKNEVDQIVTALYGALGLEIIPLRDELLTFAQFNDSDGPYIEEIVDDYLAGLNDDTPNFELNSPYQDAE